MTHARFPDRGAPPTRGNAWLLARPHHPTALVTAAARRSLVAAAKDAAALLTLAWLPGASRGTRRAEYPFGDSTVVILTNAAGGAVVGTAEDFGGEAA